MRAGSGTHHLKQSHYVMIHARASSNKGVRLRANMVTASLKNMLPPPLPDFTVPFEARVRAPERNELPSFSA